MARKDEIEICLQRNQFNPGAGAVIHPVERGLFQIKRMVISAGPAAENHRIPGPVNFKADGVSGGNRFLSVLKTPFYEPENKIVPLQRERPLKARRQFKVAGCQLMNSG